MNRQGKTKRNNRYNPSDLIGRTKKNPAMGAKTHTRGLTVNNTVLV